MKPNPLLSLNHLTVPVVRILVLPECGCVRGARLANVPITDVARELCPHDGLCSERPEWSLTTRT